MQTRSHVSDAERFEEITQLLSRIKDRSLSTQEADQLTDRMFHLIWASGSVSHNIQAPHRFDSNADSQDLHHQ